MKKVKKKTTVKQVITKNKSNKKKSENIILRMKNPPAAKPLLLPEEKKQDMINYESAQSKLIQHIDKQDQDMFFPQSKTFSLWAKRYSPVLVTQIIGLATYFYLVFYLFYPSALQQGNYMILLILLTFVFLFAGILIYIGLRTEMLFVRILSFLFVFVLFTFLLLFILVAHLLSP